jgi:hypothetical protein
MSGAKELPKDAVIGENYDFVGFITEDQIPKLKAKYFYLKTGQEDLVGEIFLNQSRNVYVYKAKVKA